jgi:hypothetical protein
MDPIATIYIAILSNVSSIIVVITVIIVEHVIASTLHHPALISVLVAVGVHIVPAVVTAACACIVVALGVALIHLVIVVARTDYFRGCCIVVTVICVRSAATRLIQTHILTVPVSDVGVLFIALLCGQTYR